jgi:exosortase A-associated hydrolase 1/exosortase A-associated hydrolase 2
MRLQPFYLDGRAGPLFAIYYAPLTSAHPDGDVLLVQSFGEELNRCRAMISMQARGLAGAGIGTLVLDAYGTGDSAGNFSDGTWELWRDDLRRGIAWLRGAGRGCRTLWGIRLGAIMAAELAAEDTGIERLLLWQPVTDGKTFFTQFLRIRIAAELQQVGGIRSTDELRSRSAGGEIIEVSGYAVGPKLAAELDSVQLPPPAALAGRQVGWFEVLSAADSNVVRANLKVVEAWQAAGVGVALTKVVGPAFWQLHERVVAEDLIPATRAWLTAPGGRHLPAQTAAFSGGTAATDGEGAVRAGAQAARESPVMFACGGDTLFGVLHRGRAGAHRGVVIVVAGGPQYRAGAHRQFVSLARKLAALGCPVLRFDLRGMGDSSGVHQGFQQSEADLRAAIDGLLREEPAVDEVVLFGECESASGILFYAYGDPRVKGIALVNPWVRTEGVQAEAILKHYYLSRLKEPDFWLKVRSGAFNPLRSMRDLACNVRAYLQGRKLRKRAPSGDEDITALPLPIKTAAGLRRFRGHVLILMSGHDYIAREFDEVIKSSQAWNGLLEDPRVCRRDLVEADHTFSREVWKSQAADWVCEWIASW